MFSESELLDGSFTGSGFSYDDEINDIYADTEDIIEEDDTSLNDFEDADMYDEAFDDDLDVDVTDEDTTESDNGFNDDFDVI